MKKKTLTQVILLIALTWTTISLSGQVTIGSGEAANAGSLLDLKMNGTTTKGLALPRVKLTTKDKLYPMLPNSYNATEDALHAGLVVYNTNKCAPFGAGFYVWDGAEWIAVGHVKGSTPPTLSGIVDTLHIPSGMDARTSVAQTMTFNSTEATSASWGNVTATRGGGLIFTSPREIGPSSGTWSGLPATLSVWPDNMTSTLVTPANPWRTRESEITITGTDDCGMTADQTLLLNQTNYAFLAGTPANPIYTIQLFDENAKTMNVLANVPWKSSVTADPGSTIGQVLASYSPSVLTGDTRSDETYHTNAFNYKGAAGGTGTKYKSATLTFSDVHGRAKDLSMTVLQCQGTQDVSGFTIQTATPTQTSTPKYDFGTGVVRHQAKAGYYEEFYSAWFGDPTGFDQGAGRWMITNLSAKKYDGVSHSGGRTLQGPKTDVNNIYSNLAYWAYPLWGTTDTEWVKNPHLGYLYTWDAATAGKGGSTGATGWNVDESGSLTWPSSSPHRQGICPKGWHLPTDFEWTALENEIIRNSTKYAHVAKNIINDGGSYLSTWYNKTESLQGTVHGSAMRDACSPVRGAAINAGVSKTIPEGGFAAPLAGGLRCQGATLSYNETAYYWSASTGTGYTSPGRTWVRAIYNSYSNVHHLQWDKGDYLSVRCVQDFK